MFAKDFENDVTPVEFMELMFNNTDNKGILYIPGWYYLDEKEHYYKCSIKWDKTDLSNVEQEFNELIKNIKEIATIYSNSRENNNIEDIIAKTDLYPAWNAYIRPFNYQTLSEQELFDISDKIDTVQKVNNIHTKIKNHKSISDYEKDFYKEHKDIKLTQQESDAYSYYCDALNNDCESRIGKSICASDLIMRARRLCRLYEINAPKIICKNEERYLAAALVVHKYAAKLEKVDC